MATLSEDQLRFLEDHNISLSIVFDATGLPKKCYQDVMRDLGMEFAYGVSPCKKAGHTLRTRAGHCIQCDTAKIAYQLRYNENGIVYIAHSRRLTLTKIGVAKDIHERLRNLNSQGYGGARDWEVVFHMECKMAGQIEMQIHKRLALYQIVRSYEKTGNVVECRELFNCSADLATNSLKECLRARNT